jgi:hypothetical protein
MVEYCDEEQPPSLIKSFLILFVAYLVMLFLYVELELVNSIVGSEGFLLILIVFLTTSLSLICISMRRMNKWFNHLGEIEMKKNGVQGGYPPFLS